jgi:hypothetical protein
MRIAAGARIARLIARSISFPRSQVHRSKGLINADASEGKIKKIALFEQPKNAVIIISPAME